MRKAGVAPASMRASALHAHECTQASMHTSASLRQTSQCSCPVDDPRVHSPQLNPSRRSQAAQADARIGALRLFSPANPTGCYCLQLGHQAHRAVAVRLFGLYQEQVGGRGDGRLGGGCLAESHACAPGPNPTLRHQLHAAATGSLPAPCPSSPLGCASGPWRCAYTTPPWTAAPLRIASSSSPTPSMSPRRASWRWVPLLLHAHACSASNRVCGCQHAWLSQAARQPHTHARQSFSGNASPGLLSPGR